MGFYDDDDKLTFDQAERTVERFVRENHTRVDSFTINHVFNSEEVEASQHNRIRFSNVLSENYECLNEGSYPLRFQMPSEEELEGRND